MADYNPDLASILNTLSALAPGHNQNQDPNGTASTQEDDSYEPSNTVPVPAPAPRPSHTQPPPQPQPPTRTTTRTTTTINDDPSTITTWPAALRYVMRTVARNEDLQHRIRRLLQSQHDHENQWWQGREGLCRKQRARGEKKRELDEVLRSVGAPVDSTQGVSTAEEDKTELQNYDAKIYSASKQMAQALMLELRGLGVPFFSIRRDLLVEKPVDVNGEDKDKTDEYSKQEPGQGLPRDELSSLQRRMLELLLDLCKE